MKPYAHLQGGTHASSGAANEGFREAPSNSAISPWVFGFSINGGDTIKPGGSCQWTIFQIANFFLGFFHRGHSGVSAGLGPFAWICVQAIGVVRFAACLPAMARAIMVRNFQAEGLEHFF